MKVALVQCPAYDVNAPPLNIAYLATYIKSKGFNAEVFDINISLYHSLKLEERHGAWNPSKAEMWISRKRFSHLPFITRELFQKYAKEIIEKGYNVVCLAVQTTSLIFAKELIRYLKDLNSEITIVLGGPGCFKKSDYYKKKSEDLDHEIIIEDNLQYYGDVFVLGEGEETLVDILTQIKEKGEVLFCPGTVVRVNGKLKDCGPRALIKDLDSIPFPTYEEFDLNLYEEYVTHKEIRVLTSRGCTAKCVFCTDTIQWKNYRVRSPQNILNEFKYLKERYNVELVTFNDSVLNGNIEHLEEVCDLLIKENVRMLWRGYARIDSKMDKKFFRKLNAACCIGLEFGIESGSDNVLKKMNKGIKSNDASAVLKNAYFSYNTWVKLKEFMKTISHERQAGRLTWDMFKKEFKLTNGGKRMKVGTNWIVGFPGETRSDLFMSMWFLLKHRFYIDTVNISMCFINPLSILESHPERFNIEYDKNKRWNSKDGNNNIDERTKRMKTMLFCSHLLGFKHGVITNHKEEN